MNDDLKEAWVKALKSGKYKQGKNRLHVKINGEEEWCCLGVLCDQFGEPALRLDKEAGTERGELTESIWKYDGDDCLLTVEMMRAVGISETFMSTVASMNDDGYDFQYIAQYIEDYLDTDFEYSINGGLGDGVPTN